MSDGGEVVVKTTLSPAQNVVGPLTEIVGTAGNGAMMIVTGFEG